MGKSKLPADLKVLPDDFKVTPEAEEASAPPASSKPPDPGVLESLADPTTSAGAAIQKFGHGASYGLTDELRGALAGQGELSQVMREKAGLEVPSSTRSVYDRILSAYRDERGAARKDLQKASDAHPVISTAAEIAGGLMAPAPKIAPMAKGATVLQRMAKMGAAAAPIGAAFGFGNSDADLTQGDVGGAALDTAKGAGLAALTSGLLGGVLHKPLSRLEGKERDAIDKASAMAQDAFDKPQNAAQGALGGVIQKGHRRLENAGNYAKDADVDPALARDLEDFISSPEGAALKNRIAQSTANGLPGNLSEIEGAQQVFDAAKAANTPENVAAKQAEILGPERFKEATMMRVKKYTGRTLIPAGAATLGAYLGGPEGAAVGGVLGGVASTVMGNPGTALANYMKDPAVAIRLAQLGQSPATLQLPAKAVSAAPSVSDEDKKRLAKYLGLMGD